MARLSEPPPSYPQWPVQYLIGCYARALNEGRNIAMMKDPADQQRLLETLVLARQLVVSYSGHIITLGMLPQPPAAERRGALQLLDSLYVACSSSDQGLIPSAATPLIPQAILMETSIVPMPLSFLEDYALCHSDESFPEVLAAIVQAIMARLATMTILGDYGTPLNVLERLISSKTIADVLVRLQHWLPRGGGALDGRALEYQTVLGPAFGISAIPDVMAHPLQPSARQPDVVQQCFPTGERDRVTEVRSAFSAVHAALKQLHTQLHRCVMILLRNTETREPMLDWLATAIRSNHERAKMRPDYKKTSTDGFMLNYCAVCLKLCEPFIDPTQGKAWGRLDSRYASDPNARGRCFDDDTRLGVGSDALAAWASGGERKYHFICEAFFLTAMALRLGISKGLEVMQSISRQANHYLEDAEGAPEHQANAMRAAARRFKGMVLAFEATIQQEDFLNDTIAYYRLVAAYLMRLACPSASAGGVPALPLPEPAPMEFSSLPEFFVEDLCGVLILAGRVRPNLVTAAGMEQYMLFFTVFLGSPSHVKNPYLRGRMVEALFSYMPPEEDDAMGPRLGRRPRLGGRAADEVATLFDVHPLVIGHMVRALIALYVDIERTDRHNTFYEKFNTRYQIGEVMAYLWRLPQHRQAWREVSERESRLYIRFINMMINDSQHLLQEALETLPLVQQAERESEAEERTAMQGQDGTELPSTQRTEREAALDSHRRALQSDFALSNIYLRTMRFSSEDPVVASRFFDVQVRDRQARILNFFLRYLTLPAERRRLKLKYPERYDWRPRELIASLAAIHVNLFRANREEWAAAVAADTDYYGPAPEIFAELTSVLRSLGLAAPEEVADLEALAQAAAAAVKNASAEEQMFDDVPEEFEDPLSCRIMTDPVKLPSGNIVDRSTILQHLLTDQRDPFSRAPMTEEDLVSEVELGQKIREWVGEQRRKQSAGA